MKEIELTQGKFALVDDEDFDNLSQYNWHYTSVGYAGRMYTENKQRKIKLMHRQIMETSNHQQVDHKDRNKLNNQKYNLRNCEHFENGRNVRAPSTNTSGYKGVSQIKKTGKWEAYIHVNNKKHNLENFENVLDAAHAYDIAAIEFFGEFASLNFDISEYIL